MHSPQETSAAGLRRVDIVDSYPKLCLTEDELTIQMPPYDTSNMYLDIEDDKGMLLSQYVLAERQRMVFDLSSFRSTFRTGYTLHLNIWRKMSTIVRCGWYSGAGDVYAIREEYGLLNESDVERPIPTNWPQGNSPRSHRSDLIEYAVTRTDENWSTAVVQSLNPEHNHDLGIR